MEIIIRFCGYEGFISANLNSLNKNIQVQPSRFLFLIKGKAKHMK